MSECMVTFSADATARPRCSMTVRLNRDRKSAAAMRGVMPAGRYCASWALFSDSLIAAPVR